LVPPPGSLHYVVYDENTHQSLNNTNVDILILDLKFVVLMAENHVMTRRRSQTIKIVHVSHVLVKYKQIREYEARLIEF
jgi:hypothetical protein